MPRPDSIAASRSHSPPSNLEESHYQQGSRWYPRHKAPGQVVSEACATCQILHYGPCRHDALSLGTACASCVYRGATCWYGIKENHPHDASELGQPTHFAFANRKAVEEGDPGGGTNQNTKRGAYIGRDRDTDPRPGEGCTEGQGSCKRRREEEEGVWADEKRGHRGSQVKPGGKRGDNLGPDSMWRSDFEASSHFSSGVSAHRSGGNPPVEDRYYETQRSRNDYVEDHIDGDNLEHVYTRLFGPSTAAAPQHAATCDPNAVPYPERVPCTSMRSSGARWRGAFRQRLGRPLVGYRIRTSSVDYMQPQTPPQDTIMVPHSVVPTVPSNLMAQGPTNSAGAGYPSASAQQSQQIPRSAVGAYGSSVSGTVSVATGQVRFPAVPTWRNSAPLHSALRQQWGWRPEEELTRQGPHSAVDQGVPRGSMSHLAYAGDVDKTFETAESSGPPADRESHRAHRGYRDTGSLAQPFELVDHPLGLLTGSWATPSGTGMTSFSGNAQNLHSSASLRAEYTQSNDPYGYPRSVESNHDPGLDSFSGQP